ncbi:MAG: NAD(P)H-dependent oxidoreductase [Labilithrix sp.]|nr:NAD(P)H-dependent oxidoreductase [Labilithrix sp.]MCW5816126.1 NAD(P)H-dependent oxidoreductase [Labilithrix sp.]
MTTDSLRILGVSGSLRKASFNTALLRAAIAIAVEEKLPISFEIATIGDLPLYDEDVRAAGLPAPVQRFRDRIAAADAILFVSPEYNFSIPGVLKNAIDWASRPPSQPFADKPCAVMGASGGMSGTMRMQYHLRQVAVFLNMHMLTGSEVFVRNAKTVFNDDLTKLTDEPTRQAVAKLLGALVAWTKRLQAS